MSDILDDIPDYTDEERLANWEREVAAAEDMNIGEEFISVVRLCRKLMDARDELRERIAACAEMIAKTGMAAMRDGESSRADVYSICATYVRRLLKDSSQP